MKTVIVGHIEPKIGGVEILPGSERVNDGNTLLQFISFKNKDRIHLSLKYKRLLTQTIHRDPLRSIGITKTLQLI